MLLDIDGTLVLSNDAHAQTWVDTFREFGYDVSFEQVRSLFGMGGDQIIPRVVPGLTDEEGDGKAIAQRRRELFLNVANFFGKLNMNKILLRKMDYLPHSFGELVLLFIIKTHTGVFNFLCALE